MATARLTLTTRQLNITNTDYETNVYVAWRGTWDGAALSELQMCVPTAPGESIVLGDILLPPPGCAHEHVWLTMYAHTRASGVKEIDASDEFKYVWRAFKAGLSSVSMRELLAAGADGVTSGVVVHQIDDMLLRDASRRGVIAAAGEDASVFVDPLARLGAAAIAEIEADVTAYATKGIFELRATVAPKHAAAARAFMRTPSCNPLPYGSPALAAAATRVFGRLEELYMRRLTDIPLDGLDVRARFTTNPDLPLAKDLHMARFETAAGPLPPIAFLLQDGSDRGHAIPPLTTAQADTIHMALQSALLRAGLTGEEFAHIVKEQHAEQGDVLHSRYLLALEVYADMATFPANKVYYKADASVPNIGWLAAQSKEKQKVYAPDLFAPVTTAPAAAPTTTKAAAPPALKMSIAGRAHVRQLFAHFHGASFSNYHAATSLGRGQLSRCHGCHHPAFAHLAHHAPLAAATPTTSDAMRAYIPKTMISGEQWDGAILAGESLAADCEDVTGAAVCVADTNRTVLTHADNAALVKARPALAALAVLAKPLMAYMAGALVSAPYETGDGGAGVAPVHIQLPVHGTPEQAKWTEGGHGFAILDHEAVMARRALAGLALGGINAEDKAPVEAKLKAMVARAAPWEQRLPTVKLEATGPSSKYTLPLSETYAGTDESELYVRKGAAKIAFGRALHAKTDAYMAALSSFCKLESQPYEVWPRQDARQMVSPFYEGVVHAVVPRMHREVSPLLGQMALVNVAERTRGVIIGAQLRDAIGAHTVALVSPYAADMTTREWNKDVAPYLATVTAQQPVSRWARDTGRAAQLAQPVPPGKLAGLAAPQTLMGAALEAATPTGASMAEKSRGLNLGDLAVIERAGTSNVLVPYTLHLDPYKLQANGVAKTTELVAALEALKRRGSIAAYAVMRDRPLPHATDAMQIVLALPVPGEIDAKVFPK